MFGQQRIVPKVRLLVEKDPFIFYMVAFVKKVIGRAILFPGIYRTNVK